MESVIEQFIVIKNVTRLCKDIYILKNKKLAFVHNHFQQR